MTLESSSSPKPISREEKVGEVAEKAKETAIEKAINEGKDFSEAEQIGKDVFDRIFEQVMRNLTDPEMPPTLRE